MSRRKFTRTGPLAIVASALGVEWDSHAPAAAIQAEGAAAVLEIRGPLSHHPDPCGFDSYDQIVDRARTCFASPAPRVLMSIDSPGGEVSGLFDTARTLAAMAESYGKPLECYVDGQACSAAFALACAASRIFVPTEGRVGSVGVIAEVWNEQRAAAAAGVSCVLVTSGARKADGHPQATVDEAMLSAIQKSVDEEAAIFWAWVAERRPITLDEVKALEAGVFHASEGIDRGLADQIATYSEALGAVPSVSAAGPAPAGAATESSAMAEDQKDEMDGIRAKLGKKAAEDSDDGRRARRALEAMDAEGDDKSEEDKPKEPDGDEGDDSAEASTASASEDDAKAEADGDDEAKAKKADDEAKAEDEEAAKASRKAEDSDARARGAKTLAEAHKAMSDASRFRNVAHLAKARARILRNQAAIFARFAKAATVAPKPKATVADKLAAGLAAGKARGTETEPKGGVKPPTAASSGRKTIAEVSPEIRRAAGIHVDGASPDPLVRYDTTGMSIGSRLSDPATAREFLATHGKAGA